MGLFCVWSVRRSRCPCRSRHQGRAAAPFDLGQPPSTSVAVDACDAVLMPYLGERTRVGASDLRQWPATTALATWHFVNHLQSQPFMDAITCDESKRVNDCKTLSCQVRPVSLFDMSAGSEGIESRCDYPFTAAWTYSRLRQQTPLSGRSGTHIQFQVCGDRMKEVGCRFTHQGRLLMSRG